MSLIILLSLIASISPEVLDCKQSQFNKLAQRADTILIAQVIEVYPPPAYWTGTDPSTQRVRYQVKAVIKGNTPEKEILVGHYVIKNSLTARTDYPGLSEKLFIKGKLLVLFLKSSNQTENKSDSPERIEYISVSENCGAVAATTKTIKIIKGLVSSNKSIKR